MSLKCSNAVAQSKFSRQRVPDGSSRDTESVSCVKCWYTRLLRYDSISSVVV